MNHKTYEKRERELPFNKVYNDCANLNIYADSYFWNDVLDAE